METHTVAAIPSEDFDQLEALHAEYAAKFKQSDEFTSVEWAQKYYGGNRKKAYNELEYYCRPGGEMTKRNGKDDAGRACALYRLNKKSPSE